MTASRGQTGLDLIASYGWVVLVGVGSALILSQMGAFNPSQCGKSLLGFSQVVPVDWTVYIGTDIMVVSVQVENWAGNDVEVDNLSASFEDLSCSGIANAVLEPGNKSTVTLNCTGSKGKNYHHGDCYNVHLDINYHNLASGNYDDSQGKIRGVFEEYVATTSTTTSTTIAVTTTTSTTTTICASDNQCPFCQKCVAGFCANEGAEDTKNECPGALGACAAGTCNGAGACLYLSGKQPGCNGACQACSGASYSCSNVAAGSDTYGDCTGNCDECNGAGACRSNNALCSGNPASCYCSGSGTAYNCQSCPDSFGTCGDPTCASYACSNSVYAVGTDCGGVCQSCNGAGACVNTAAGSDYQNECPGVYGVCAGGNCNGAGACQYLSGKQPGCNGACQACSGSSFSCSNVAAGSDTYGDCTGNCDECNGAGACRANNALCANTVASCTCTGSGNSYNCQSCSNVFGVCGYAQCSGYVCSNPVYAAGTDCGGFCQSCDGSGNCVNTANGLDYQNECPSGACAGANCNGAGTCQYLGAGKQSCPLCQYCTGVSYACSNVGAGTDPYNDCAPLWNGCSNICVKSGLDGNCNGVAACTSTTANVAVGNYCSAGNEVAGVCNAAYACTNAQNTNGAYNNAVSPFWTQAYCTGAGACTRTGATASADLSSAACTCRNGTGRWAIGGEVDAAGCCGNDAGEYKRTKVCTSGCTSDATDDACCNLNNKCVLSSTCYANAACSGTLKCNAGSWIDHCSNGIKDCSETAVDCGGGGCPACDVCTKCCKPGSKTCKVTNDWGDLFNFCGDAITDCWTDGWTYYITSSSGRDENLAPAAQPLNTCKSCP